MENEIVILAAGPKTWLKERFLPSAWKRYFYEQLVPEYAEKMDKLREIDDQLYEWTKDLEALVSSSESAFDSGRIVDVAIYLATLNSKLKKIEERGKEIPRPNFEEINKVLREIDKGNYPYIDKELFDFGKIDDKTAGWWDDLKKKWVSERFRGDFIKKRKLALKHVINVARTTVDKVKDKLSLMHDDRAKGDIEGYIKKLNEISLLQKAFQNNFKPIYKEYLKGLVDEVLAEQEKTEKYPNESAEQFIDPTKMVEKEEQPKVEPAKVDPVKVEPAPIKRDQFGNQIKEPEIIEKQPETVPSESEKQIESEEIEVDIPTEPTKEEEEEAPKTLPSEDIKKSHQEFFLGLVKKSSYLNEGEIALEVLKYSEKIEDYDLDTSMKLLAVVEGVLDE